MKLIRFTFLALIAVMIYSCSGTKKGSQLSGTISDASDMSIYFDRQGMDNANETLLNTKADADGNFSFTIPQEGLTPGIYRVRAGAKSATIILKGDEKNVKMTGDLKSFADLTYTVEGAPLTEEYLDIIGKFVNKEIDVPKLSEMAKSSVDPLIGYMISTKMFLFNPQYMDLHEKVGQNLQSTYPDIRLSKEYAKGVQQKKREYAAKLANEKVKVGQPAPEIALPGPDGKVRKLSDMQGKVVLLDFWASWCGPCRKANPHVVDVYKRYKDQGFDVFSVSLDGLDTRSKARFKDESQIKSQMDRQKERWVAAIDKDNLIWDAHVSDLAKWESAPAATYGVKSIPKTFLIGRDGNIVAVNPRNNLEQQVKKNL